MTRQYAYNPKPRRQIVKAKEPSLGERIGKAARTGLVAFLLGMILGALGWPTPITILLMLAGAYGFWRWMGRND